jgi:hypothetical protein
LGRRERTDGLMDGQIAHKEGGLTYLQGNFDGPFVWSSQATMPGNAGYKPQQAMKQPAYVRPLRPVRLLVAMAMMKPNTATLRALKTKIPLFLVTSE